jgi:hypothetical protein
MDRTVLALCPMARFGISSVEPPGSATREIISKTNLKEIGYEDGSGSNWLRIVSSGTLWYLRC